MFAPPGRKAALVLFSSFPPFFSFKLGLFRISRFEFRIFITMITRRKFFAGAAALLGASSLAQRIAGGTNLLAAQATPAPSGGAKINYHPVVTPNGSSLPWVMKSGVKEFQLIAEPVRREFAP